MRVLFTQKVINSLSNHQRNESDSPLKVLNEYKKAKALQMCASPVRNRDEPMNEIIYKEITSFINESKSNISRISAVLKDLNSNSSKFEQKTNLKILKMLSNRNNKNYKKNLDFGDESNLFVKNKKKTNIANFNFKKKWNKADNSNIFNENDKEKKSNQAQRIIQDTAEATNQLANNDYCQSPVKLEPNKINTQSRNVIFNGRIDSFDRSMFNKRKSNFEVSPVHMARKGLDLIDDKILKIK